MKLQESSIAGVWVLEAAVVQDERGTFARTFCRDELLAHGLDARVAQCSLSRNLRRGTLRGMHYQAAPHAELKLIRCTLGSVFDVALDLRPESATFCRWLGFELSAEAPRSLYLPPGVAHGFVTLSDDAELCYQISVPYAPAAARGVRWDDPVFDIRWPLRPLVMSEKDRSYPDFLIPS